MRKLKDQSLLNTPFCRQPSQLGLEAADGPWEYLPINAN
jgi:hypothetical protein